MKIAYLGAGKGMPSEARKRREEILNSFTHAGNQVVVEAAGTQLSSIESSIEESWAIPGMLRKLRAIQNDYDAVILGCAGDPGLRPLRELSTIPVIGPAESAFYTACMMGDQFGVITILEAGIPSKFATQSLLREYGLDHKCASIQFLGLPVLEIRENPEMATEQVKANAIAAKKEGASVIVYGCMSISFLMIDELVEEASGLPVANPVKTAVKMAEMFAELGLSHSRFTYPAADIKKLDKTIFA